MEDTPSSKRGVNRKTAVTKSTAAVAPPSTSYLAPEPVPAEPANPTRAIPKRGTRQMLECWYSVNFAEPHEGPHGSTIVVADTDVIGALEQFDAHSGKLSYVNKEAEKKNPRDYHLIPFSTSRRQVMVLDDTPDGAARSGLMYARALEKDRADNKYDVYALFIALNQLPTDFCKTVTLVSAFDAEDARALLAEKFSDSGMDTIELFQVNRDGSPFVYMSNYRQYDLSRNRTLTKVSSAAPTLGKRKTASAAAPAGNTSTRYLASQEPTSCVKLQKQSDDADGGVLAV